VTEQSTEAVAGQPLINDGIVASMSFNPLPDEQHFYDDFYDLGCTKSNKFAILLHFIYFV